MAVSRATGYTNLPNDNFIPEIYSQKVQKFFRTASVVEDITNTDYAGEIENFGDTVRIIKENSDLEIANTVQSPYPDPEALFEKQTWISKIGIYDKDKNLIAIAKLASPVRKTEEREFTFKLKLDF